MGATYTASAVFKAVDRLSVPMNRMGKASQTFAKKSEIAFARVERRIRKVKKAVGGLGLIMGGAILFTAVSSMVSIFADFEQANASLASVMSSATEPQLVAMQTDAKRLGATTAKTATEVIGLQEAFARLGFESGAIINMTQATINGSIAMQGELADTAGLVGAMVKSFDSFSSIDAPRIIDQMTLATQKSALNFEKLQTGLPIVAGAANAAGIPFTRLMALMGKLSDAGIDASSSSTALRNIFLDSAKKGHSYEQILNSIQKNQSKLTAANDEFGKRGAVSAVILAKQFKGIEKLDEVLKSASNTAQTAANKQLNTLTGRFTLMKSAYEGFILSIEDGNGSIGNFLKSSVEIATEMLSLLSNTARASDELNSAELRIRKLAERGLFLVKILKWAVIGFVALKVVMIAVKTQMFIAKSALIAYNIVLGLTTALTNTSVFAIRGNVIALHAWKVATMLQTAAQWALNVALNANPIGLIIIAIVALIAIVTVVIKKWDTWGAALSLVLGPLGLIIGLIQSFRTHWEQLKASFTEGGFVKGIITIGKVMLDAILYPVQQVLELLGKIPGMDIATSGAAKLEAMRGKMFEYENGLLPEQKSLETTKTTTAQENIKREERITKQSATLNINNNSDQNLSLDNPQGAPIMLTATN